MRFGIDIGHNCPPDTGANGIKFEDNLTLDVGNRVMGKLKDLGHQVIDCKPAKSDIVGNSLRQRCAKANESKVDIFVSIHFNAFNGFANGTEIFAVSDTAKKIAKSILNEIVQMGFFNRGIKNGSHLFVLRNINMPAILLECCFLDSAKDMKLFDSEAMANAIVKGLTGKLPVARVISVPDESQNPDVSILRLQKALNRLRITDYNSRPLDEDNAIGTATVSAINKFQEIVGIQQTGIAGDTTWGAINQVLAKPVLRKNHAAGIVMKYLQYRVGAEPDGIYGSFTEAAIQQFQTTNGLYADGIVGNLTWRKLIG
ncbi:N-acetylmuramoyl-L-alanine amidase [Rivularia sp. UHCC 0363]|uniref:N-acetylmuramoyl-L-alanine amidase n=1 Tax=Rivularia sp. UHCC 0363 TaxID=3110244 RepID=UPI002B20E424|nr:N-acetylmuramoyl-L-alanine amidase [Rivularia sp. UHCC 0363]MEA5597615.1 N-acetylmuramoyl-L-alanine amidase [Rivularia sp. UHCC 0363]